MIGVKFLSFQMYISREDASVTYFYLFLLQLFRINEANQLMQYDQCLTKGADGSKVMITHCNLNEFKEWQYFKVFCILTSEILYAISFSITSSLWNFNK